MWIKRVRPSPGATDLSQPPLQPALPLQTPPPRPTELSTMAHIATIAVPRIPGLLWAALLLLLLVTCCQDAAGAPVVNELRCQCLQTRPRIHPKQIQSVKVIPPGASCDQTEVVATLKNGQEVCLNPEAPFVKKIIEKMLNKGSSN
ncbi:growth-regulated alpha protein [Glossophaga mutica]